MPMTGAERVANHRKRLVDRIAELEREVVELTHHLPPPLHSGRRMTKAVAELSEEWIEGHGGLGVGLDLWIGGVAFGIELMKGLNFDLHPEGCSIDEALNRMCEAMLANKVAVGSLSTCKTGSFWAVEKWRQDHGGDKQHNEEIDLAKMEPLKKEQRGT